VANEEATLHGTDDLSCEVEREPRLLGCCLCEVIRIPTIDGPLPERSNSR
jgi:hypothetical protein